MSNVQSAPTLQIVSKGEIALLILTFLKEEKLQETEQVFCREAQKLLHGLKKVSCCQIIFAQFQKSNLEQICVLLPLLLLLPAPHCLLFSSFSQSARNVKSLSSILNEYIILKQEEKRKNQFIGCFGREPMVIKVLSALWSLIEDYLACKRFSPQQIPTTLNSGESLSLYVAICIQCDLFLIYSF
jgi:hypothetical protein